MYRQDNSKIFMKDPSTANCRVYIGNLSDVVSSQDLETHFSKYGNVLGVNLHKGFGFIQYEKELSVNDAIKMEHQNIFHGRNLVVRRAQSGFGYQNVSTNREQGMFTGLPVHDNPRQGRLADNQQFGGGFPDSGGRGRRSGDMNRPRGGMSNAPGRLNMLHDRSPIDQQNMYPPMNLPKGPNNPPTNRDECDRNDCEIIVLAKSLTKYAEFIEEKLLNIGLTVDLLYPNDDVPIRRVLANISSRGCLYAILVLPQNQEHHSMTLNILYGSPQEHRNILLSDGITLMKNDYEINYKGNGAKVQNFANVPFAKDRHPNSIHALISILDNNKMLTVLQYDKLIRYLQDRREEQVKTELGDCNDIAMETTQTKTQQELQQRILSILNKPDTVSKPNIPDMSMNPQWSSSQLSKPPTSTPILYDPTVQKALDSLIQGNLLQNIGVNRFS